LLTNFTAGINSTHAFASFQWDFGDGNGSNVQNPSHLYTLPGSYQVSLIATTASGCRDTFLLDSIITILGPQGSFNYQPLAGCAPFSISGTTQLSSTASNAIDFDDGNVSTGSPLLNTFSHTYTQAGVYYPVMILDDGMGCRVSVTTPDSVVVFPKPTADFVPSQASLCDTGSLQFLDRSSSASQLASWRWDFGDNSGSSLQNPVHFYSGPGNYTVQLIVENVDGCRDTARIPSAIQVFPAPQAGMRLSGIAGCTPYYLEAFDASPAGNAPIVDWLWDFGVAGASERNRNASFTYLTPGVYTVSLTVRDANGCVTTIDTVIEAWERPVADFVSRGDSMGCAPFPVTFLDKSRGPVPMAAWNWQYGNGDSSTAQNPGYVYQQDGKYDLQLIVTDVRGCDDTIRKNEYIKLDHPLADFSANPTVGCPPLSVQFTDLSRSDTSLIRWTWRFGDGGNGMGSSPTYNYLNSGVYDIWLEVEDAFGCKDSIEKPELITVLPDVVPDPPAIRYVSVTGDLSIDVIWGKYLNSLDDFGAYILEENDGSGWREIMRSNQIDDTSFTARGLNTRENRYCYRLLVENFCESTSAPASSGIHCAVQLEATSANEAIQLNWSAYQGWPLVDRYVVYRVRDYSPAGATRIAELPGDSLTYLDTTMFCYRGHTYRIQAIAAHEDYISQSNIDEAAPEHAPLGDSLHMVRATVIEDNFVQIEWEKPFVRQGDLLVLERWDGSLWEPLWEQAYSSNNTILEDRNTFVDVASYRYRGFVIDSCGDRLPQGREGRSILLSGERKRGTNYLEWTPYAQWEEGVRQYEILVFNEENQQQELVGRTDGTVTGFEDYTTDFIQRQYCYTIRAIEEGGNDTFALSNEICLYIDPTLYVPTAFSPNGDGHNEIFYIPSTYVGAYKLEIFNRWGNKLFESSDPNQGWDGKANGMEVPEGVYVWRVYATGLTGRPVIEQAGTVTLIR
jgi:gliding motility-associated-like protein